MRMQTQCESDKIIAAQARLISRLHSVIKDAASRAERAEVNYERVKLAGQFYMMLQGVITENPILQSEWNRFLSFVKLADAKEQLQLPPRWSAPLPPPAKTEAATVTISAAEREILKQIVPDLMSEVFVDDSASTAEMITYAINHRMPISFRYKSKTDSAPTLRVVEPYTLGEHVNGNRILIGREVSKDGDLVPSSGSDKGLRSFTEANIEKVSTLLTETFKTTPPPPDLTKWSLISASV